VKNICRQSVGAVDGDDLCSRREDTSLPSRDNASI